MNLSSACLRFLNMYKKGDCTIDHPIGTDFNRKGKNWPLWCRNVDKSVSISQVIPDDVTTGYPLQSY